MGVETAAAITLIGAGVSAGTAIHGNRQQKKAARSAAAAADKVAKRAVAQAAGSGEVKQVESAAAAGAEQLVQGQAKRRFSMDDTVQRFAANGLRKSLN